MHLLYYTKHRLEAFIAEAGRLSDAEFPYSHSRTALIELKRYFEECLAVLKAIDPKSEPEVIKQFSGLVLGDFFAYLPLLGFILRSTNVRNAFEAFRPLLRLARQVLEPSTTEQDCTTKLLISSEWDYSPLTYNTIAKLPGYVFIGFPAPESANPLVVPLAGHELGHAVWVSRGLDARYRPILSAAVVEIVQARWDEYVAIFHPDFPPEEVASNLGGVESWSTAVNWAVSQAEESFCDYCGLELFRESYVSAFAYLLSPSLGNGTRSIDYPPLDVRAARLAKAAQQLQIDVPADYEELFEPDTPPPLVRADEFRVSVADAAVASLVDDIATEAAAVVKAAGLLAPQPSETDRILARFRQAVPAEQCTSLTALLNAGWLVFSDPDFWPSELVPAESRHEVLRELLLKNFEIFEMEHIKGGHPA